MGIEGATRWNVSESGGTQDEKVRGGDVAERLLNLGAAVTKLTEALPRRPFTRHLGLQLIRSVTSAGANYQEARRAESRADSVHKIGVAAKELGETLYWLRLTEKLTSPGGLLHALREADELVAILVASARTARR
jgi:four helix bundle protein